MGREGGGGCGAGGRLGGGEYIWWRTQGGGEGACVRWNHLIFARPIGQENIIHY